MYLLYVPSLYVHERRQTIAQQARQKGQDKRSRPPARLEQGHRISTTPHTCSHCTGPIHARSDIACASLAGRTRAHSKSCRRPRSETADRRSCRRYSERSIGHAPREHCRDAQHPRCPHAPRASGAVSPWAADRRGSGALKRALASSWLPAIVAGGQTEATSGLTLRRHRES